MRPTAAVLASAGEEPCKIGTGCEFPAPGLNYFVFEPLFSFTLFGYQVDFTKPMLYTVVATVLIGAFMVFAFGRPKLVPRGIQNVGEYIYDFIRDQIAKDTIGKQAERYVPYLMILFLFIFVLNIFAIIPFIQFPPTAHIAFPMFLAVISWVIYLYLGMRHQGPIGYFKNVMFPPGLPKGIYPILAPIEFFSTILVRPFTLAIRLFANMFAGHLLILMFTLGANYLFVVGISALAAVASGVMTFVILGFELLILSLQAYIFTILTASYIGESLSTEH